jgi:tetratricopeptide (TPR) repeat protein
MSKRRSAARWIAFAFVPLLLFSACASSAPAPDLMKRASAEATQYLESGDYQGALSVLKAQLREDPGNREWEAEVAAALDEIHGIAESAFRRQNYARAERIYRLLLDHYDDFERFSVRLAFSKSELETGASRCRIAVIDQAAGQALKSGDPAKALDIYAEAFREIPGDRDLAAKYLRVVREVKAAGEKALAGGDFAQAGKLHSLLLQRFLFFESMKLSLTFGRSDLAAALAACRDGLTKAGLAEYRNGNLAKAIAVWEALLAFDPGNAEIKKAVDTARIQMKKIDRDKTR